MEGACEFTFERVDHPAKSLYLREHSRRYRVADERYILGAAQAILRGRVASAVILPSSRAVREFLVARLSHLEHEVFALMLLDTQNRLIGYAELFRGTLTRTTVHPREVVKEALANNASAVILVHNHPSGLLEPSAADRSLTKTLQSALALVDVSVLDHILVGGGAAISFAEKGLL